MKTLVELDDKLIEALDTLAARSKQSRSALIRKAIADYLAGAGVGNKDDGFGLWGNRKVDGLAFQRKMRAEW